MSKFRKKPVVIDAVQFKGDVGDPDIMDLDLGCRWDEAFGCDVLVVPTLEGTMVAYPGDWIITGVAGEKYPCKPGIFKQTYEAVE